MGDIKSNSKFNEDQTALLKEALIESLKNNNGTKKVIQLNGKSSLLFANLTALTLASCGGGGGGGSTAPATPTSSFSIGNQSYDFTEDTAKAFTVTSSGSVSDSFTITVQSIPSGGTLTLASGTVLTVGATLSLADLEGITFTPNENANSDNSTIGDFVLTIVDNTVSSTATISLVVSAVNDAPTIGTADEVQVLESVAAGTVLLTLTGSDVDGDTLTYSLTGDDAALFDVDSSGGISFKASPSYSAPSDANGDSTYSLNLVATDSGGLFVQAAISIVVQNLTSKGQAIDGYLVGATVWVDLDGDGIKDANEPETTTDKTGAFEFDISIPTDTNIYVEGGYDLGTGKPNEQTFKLTTSSADASEALIVSPVSTQISRAYAKSGVSLAEAQEKIGKAYGLDTAFENLTNFDPIALAYSASSNTQAQAALTAQARNIMVSSLGELSKKVSEYFSTEISPTTRSQISDIFKFGTETLRYSSWDSGVDLSTQPRIVIELEGLEDLLDSTSDTFNDKIVEAILASDDLTKIFEMKADGSGQFDQVITQATNAIILEIKNLILSEMGFDPATGFKTFKPLDGYTGETVEFLGSTKTMGEWAVLMVDILDSQQPDPYLGRVNFGPDGGVTDMVGKYYAEQMVKMVRLMETMTGLTFENLTNSQIDQIVDMGFEYQRGATFNESYSRWVPFDEFGQELWSQEIRFNYSGERLRYDSNGNEIQGNTGQWQLTADQVKAYLKDPTLQINDGNWGNDFSTYNWTVKTGDLGVYLALAEGRTTAEVTTLLNSVSASEDAVANFNDILTASFTQATKVFSNLVTGALDFTLDKFTSFVEKQIDYRNDEQMLPKEAFGMPVSTVETVSITGTPVDKTIAVTVSNDGNGNKYYFDGVLAPDYTFDIGATYTFDVSDSSNSGHPFRLSTTQDGTHNGGVEFTTGVTFNSGAVVLTVDSNTPSTLYYYCDVHSGMANAAVLNALAVAGTSFELESVSGIGYMVTGDALNPDVQEAGDFSYSITGGADKDLFRVSDNGSLSFKDTAPDPSDPNDSNSDGEYIVEVTITDNSDSFQQVVEFVMAIPDWDQTRTYSTDTKPSLISNVINVEEHSIMRQWNSYNQETGENPRIYNGVEVQIAGLEGLDPSLNVNVWLPERDDAGNKIKDNSLFYIQEEGGKYYLSVRDANSLDFEDPKDSNADNVYELSVNIEIYGDGADSIGTRADLLFVVNSNSNDPAVAFPEWWQDDAPVHGSFAENQAGVATLTQVTIDGTQQDNVFVVGDVWNIDHQPGVNPQTIEELQAIAFAGSVTSTITGGPDADKFFLRDTDWGTQVFFAERPVFASPADADGNNIYEFELTKTGADGSSITKTARIEIREKDAGSPDPIVPPSSPLVFSVDEIAEKLDSAEGSRSIVGTDGDDIFARENNGFQYIDGGDGNDNFDNFREGYLTGGAGGDIFQLSGEHLENPLNFGIRDYAKNYLEGAAEGINGYDENRDGVLDLATELNWTRVALISDFTPGVDTLALTTLGWTGNNVPNLSKADISFVQGTGDLADHTFVMLTGKRAEDQGLTEGGIIAVLLDIDATTISKDTDVTEVGPEYDNVLGNIKDAIGATVTIIQDQDGRDTPILQLPDGQYVWLGLDYTEFDNSSFFQNFAVASDGTLYVPRTENLDFESPKDGNKDNIYELLFTGSTFTSIELTKEDWGGYNVDWDNSDRTGNIAFKVFIDINDVISDNVGKLSIAEADFFSASDAQTGDAALDSQLIDLVLSQISAVQGSLMDIDFKAIAEEINFDFAFFSTADQQTQAEDWFGDYQENRFSDFNRELEETFERNLLSKFSSYTNADSLTNISGTAESETLAGTDLKETIFGKKGDDIITGGGGDDVIFGDQGADTLDGGSGSDAIDGGSGDDTIIIGEGLDVLDGGSGNDKFDFTSISSLPEFIKGGSGVDTLVLSGLSSVGLEVDDGTDADSLPDFTGIDLNKLVSVKETWTYQDESGNTVNEEGWRNRVESIEKIDLRDSESLTEAVFNDELNITWDALQRMSWDNRTWTIRGDDTDTVRLLGHEYSYNEGSTIKTQFEAFRAKGTIVEDGITYNVYELWDGRVNIEQGITVVHTKRDLGKSVAGENTRPDFWYQYTTVYENSTAVFGAVKDSWDADGDTITYSLASTPDATLFDINSSTGEVTFKVAPNYEAPASISTGASSVGSAESDFSSLDQNSLRQYNQYQLQIIGDDGSEEANAQNTYTMYVDVRNLPDYEGYDSSNKIPFFKDMWGSDSKFIDDAANQSIQIKGFDLDFDTLTWELLGVRTDSVYGTMEDGSNDSQLIGAAPFTLSSTGLFTPNSTLSYEDGNTSIEVYVGITDGKSTQVKKTYNFQIEDTLGDGSLSVSGTAMIGSYSLANATIWQDLDNDGIKDVGEPSTTSNLSGRFDLTVSKSSTDTPILATGGFNAGTGEENEGLYKINSNLKLTSGRDWGEYSLSPMSSVAYSMQNLDRSILDKATVTDMLKAFGMDPLWMDGDGNFFGERFYDIKNRLDGQTSAGEWETFNLNIFTLTNMLTIMGEAAMNSATSVIGAALEDVNTKVSETSNVSGYSAASLTAAQQTSIKHLATQALADAIAETVTGKTSFDGFRMSESNPVTITDHEGTQNVIHTPSFTVASNVLTLNSSEIQVNQAALQDALELKAGSKGLKIEVEVGTLPTTAQTIAFKGKLIDGSNGTIDTGERAVEVQFQVLVDPTQAVGSSQYVYVPASSDITVIYTGEDGTTSTTTVNHSGNMVNIETSSTGIPKFVVDFTEVFARGIPETNLSTYFTTSTASNGNYYMELDFSGSTLTTSSGDSFDKVVAPFKVAASTTPVVYFDDITVSEARGWNQIELKLSKPATETFTLEYNLDSSGTATQNDDFWWWSDESGYRSVTFVEGQSTAVINVDVRNDSTTESDETIVYGIRAASGSEGKIILPKSSVTVTINDDESASSVDLNSLVDTMYSKLSSALSTELKTLTDANTASLSGTSTSFTDILLSNSDISDISTYLASEISDDVTLYSPVSKAVMTLIDTYVAAVRGPSGIRESLKLNGSEQAKDMAALAVGFDTLNFSEFTATASADLNTALINDIYSDSGFKYTGTTTVSSGQSLTYSRVIDANSSAYANLLFPAGVGNRDTTYEQGTVTITNGTSGNDTVNLNASSTNVLYQGLAGNDDITLSDSNSGYLVFGGAGDDIIKDSNDSGRSTLLDGGEGDDILSSASQHALKMTGGAGNDVFVIEYNSASFKWDSGNAFEGNDNNQDGTLNFDEYYSIQGIITDFQDGSDKIGLRGSDWSGKTIVVQQGQGSMSNHTFLLTGATERGGDSDPQYWMILWNTTASSITDADFVLVDANYATSSLSGVTISSDAADAGLDTSDMQLDSGNSDIENAFFMGGLVDNSDSLQFDNISNSNPAVDLSQIDNFFSQDVSAAEDSFISIFDTELDEEILISIDIV